MSRTTVRRDGELRRALEDGGRKMQNDLQGRMHDAGTDRSVFLPSSRNLGRVIGLEDL